MTMNLFTLLYQDNRVIVLSDHETGTFYTWNKNLTLQCWTETGKGSYDEVDIRTLSNKPANYEAASKEALEWHNEAPKPDQWCNDVEDWGNTWSGT